MRIATSVPAIIVSATVSSASVASAFVASATIAIAALLAATSTVHAAQVSARMSVTLAGVKLGEMRYRARIAPDGAAYAVSGSIRSAGLAAMVSRVKGNAESTGRLVNGDPRPQRHAMTWREGRRGGRMTMTFAPIAVEAEPPIKPRYKAVPVEPEHLVGAIDPLSAMLRGGDPCRGRLELFDGRNRYDLVLAPERADALEVRGATVEARRCTARYVAISGHKRGRRSLKTLAKRTIQMTYARVPGSTDAAPMWLLAAFSLPTKYGRARGRALEWSHDTGS